MIADSGGFQISIGRLSRRESDLLRVMYYDWIEEYHEVLDKAFILDIPPGPGCEIFHNFDDVYKLNLESYERARSLFIYIILEHPNFGIFIQRLCVTMRCSLSLNFMGQVVLLQICRVI